MRIEHPIISDTARGLRVEAQVGGMPLFWEVDRRPGLIPRGEPFVAAVLPVAMQHGTAIDVPAELPVDATFLSNLDLLQTIYARWFPGTTRVQIRATVAPRSVPAVGVATGYSGGVDSSYTLNALRGTIDAALLIDGIEFRTDLPDLFGQVRVELGETVAARGLELVTVQTNVKAFSRHFGVKWSHALGSALASSVHAVGFSRYFVAASNSWENLRPFGSHPLTEPLWSSAQVRLEHHGAELNRIEKIVALGEIPDLLNRLRVCFQGTGYNCGSCHKCLMTMTGLRVAGITSEALPALKDARKLRVLEIAHDGHLLDWTEMQLPGLEQRDPELHRELNRLVRRYRWRRLVKSIDEQTTGGKFRGLFTKGKKLAAL